MKHTKYSIFKALYHNPDISYIKQFFSANIKTLYTYPKSIWYSLRLNYGEKFMLHNPNIYPYTYNGKNDNEIDNHPVNRASKLNANLGELEVITYLLRTRNESYLKTKLPRYLNESRTEADSTYTELVRMINLINSSDLDLPVYVYSQVMYGYNLNSKYKFNTSTDITDKNDVVTKFMSKVEYASAEAATNAMAFLVNTNNFDNNVWNKLLQSFASKEFVPEFTQVSNKTPFLFRYKEVDNKELKNFLLDEVSNNMFLLGKICVKYIRI